MLALLLVLGGDVRAGDDESSAPPLSWVYRDKVHKFSLAMFEGHQPVPQKVSEKTVLCQFRNPNSKGQARGTFDPEVIVVRFNTNGTAAADTTDGPLRPEELREKVEERDRPKDLFDATFGRLLLGKDERERIERLKGRFTKIESQDAPKLPGRLWEFALELPSFRGTMSMHVCLAEFERDGVATGIYMRCDKSLKRGYAKSFVKIAKSFKWVDMRARDVRTLDVLDGVNITTKTRHDIERNMISNWDIIVSPKKNYIVLYNTKRGKNHLLARTISKRVESIREQLYEKHFPLTNPIDTACIVRVCGNRKEYAAYGGPGGSASYWSLVTGEIVLYDASPAKKPDDDTLYAVKDAAFKPYLWHALGSVSPHAWFTMGHGDFYAGARIKDGKFVIKPSRWRSGTLRGAILQGPRALEQSGTGSGRTEWGRTGYTPLRHFVRFGQQEYRSYPSVSAAQGWGLIYFLREIVPTKVEYEKEWGHILETYFETLRAAWARKAKALDPTAADARPVKARAQEAARKEALHAAFHDVDWDKLEAAWVKAMKDMR